LGVKSLAWRVEHFAEIDSTNSWIKARALEGADEGLVAHADFQAAGRGRLDRRWRAAPGTALLCSILVRPAIDVGQLQLVVAAVALSVREALSLAAGLRADLKWPNDLIVADRKLAGVLAEVVADARGPAVVVGVGVNLTDHPNGAASTSVFEASGKLLAARDLLEATLGVFAPRRALLDDEAGRARLGAEYASALATLGRHVAVIQRDGVVRGEALRVDPSGRLVVRRDGEELCFAAGDVVHVRLDEGARS
jgi:BirA family transcriptional regulator, biotin operon repressor / biotin---[acetyl-CoA-carboxylase] ligase